MTATRALPAARLTLTLAMRTHLWPFCRSTVTVTSDDCERRNDARPRLNCSPLTSGATAVGCAAAELSPVDPEAGGALTVTVAGADALRPEASVAIAVAVCW